MDINQFRRHLAKMSNKESLIEEFSEKELLTEDTSGIEKITNDLIKRIDAKRELLQKYTAIESVFSKDELKKIEDNIVSAFRKYLPAIKVKKITALQFKATGTDYTRLSDAQNVNCVVQISIKNHPDENLNMHFGTSFGYPDVPAYMLRKSQTLKSEQVWEVSLQEKYSSEPNPPIFRLDLGGRKTLKFKTLDQAFTALKNSYIFKG
jgi:hypothetical protein